MLPIWNGLPEKSNFATKSTLWEYWWTKSHHHNRKKEGNKSFLAIRGDPTNQGNPEPKATNPPAKFWRNPKCPAWDPNSKAPPTRVPKKSEGKLWRIPCACAATTAFSSRVPQLPISLSSFPSSLRLSWWCSSTCTRGNPGFHSWQVASCHPLLPPTRRWHETARAAGGWVVRRVSMACGGECARSSSVEQGKCGGERGVGMQEI